MPRKLWPVIAVCLLFIVSLPGCSRNNDLNSRINRAAAPYRFSLFSWEVKTLAGEVGGLFKLHQATANATSLEKQVERQIREALAARGIYNPADRFFTLKIGFPPVTLYLGDPLHLLVVSTRDRIETVAEVTLVPDMDENDMKTVEAEIESFGYSALVVELGGMATFPSYVSNDADMKFILETTAHEWTHQYLAFTPLGFLYVLDEIGIRRDYDIATMNETVADTVGHEIGDMVYQKYYAPPATGNATSPAKHSGFDFNATMREIRKNVDALLVQGKITAAEDYMNEQRQYLEDNGYYIRKLNQAYFAFYGTYADSPTSVSPIGQELKNLRDQSPSLKDFLHKVSGMSSRADLEASVR
jgi:hypothetical protein